LPNLLYVSTFQHFIQGLHFISQISFVSFGYNTVMHTNRQLNGLRYDIQNDGKLR